MCYSTIDEQGRSRLAACLSGAFVLFVLAGAVCISKNKNHSKIHRWQGPCSFAGAEMQPDRERPAEHTFRMVKRIDAVWADFCPAKPCLPLFMDGKYTIIQKLPCVKSKSSSSRPTRTSSPTRWPVWPLRPHWPFRTFRSEAPSRRSALHVSTESTSSTPNSRRWTAWTSTSWSAVRSTTS